MVIFLARYGTILTFLALVIGFSAFLPAFHTSLNVFNILGQTAIVGLFSVALTCCLKLGDFDFSIGATGSLSGLVVAMLLVRGIDTSWAIGIALLMGVLIGIFNGVLVGYLKFNSFICTIGTSLVVFGISMGLTKGQSVILTPEIAGQFEYLGRGSFQQIPIRFLIMMVFSVPIWLFHAYTETGRGIEAIAGNAAAARLYGIRVDSIRMLSFVLSGICSSMGGVVMTSSLMSARPTDNLHYILGALAACFIGAGTIRIGLFHIGGTLLGVFMTVVATNGLIILMVPSYATKMATGAILLLAILLSIMASRFIRNR
jgi:ribose transport system permease protein